MSVGATRFPSTACVRITGSIWPTASSNDEIDAVGGAGDNSIPSSDIIPIFRCQGSRKGVKNGTADKMHPATCSTTVQTSAQSIAADAIGISPHFWLLAIRSGGDPAHARSRLRRSRICRNL